jgi:hypothetical protein
MVYNTLFRYFKIKVNVEYKLHQIVKIHDLNFLTPLLSEKGGVVVFSPPGARDKTLLLVKNWAPEMKVGIWNKLNLPVLNIYVNLKFEHYD